MYIETWLFLLLVLLAVTINVIMFPHFNQTDSIIISERIMVNSANAKYQTATMRNFKFNRTHIATNGTLTMNTNFGYDLTLDIQAYRFASNEYRLFPITFTINLCESISNNDFGIQNMYNCGNLTKCPFTKGTYTVCNWGPDYTKFPPHIPSGRYRMDIKALYKNEQTLDLSWYMEVKSTKFLYRN